VKKLAVAFAVLAGILAVPQPAQAGQCGIPNRGTLWIDFGDGSVPFWYLFARPGVISAAANFIYPPRIRAAGAKTVYFDLNFRHRIGTPTVPEDPAVVAERANRLFDYAAASSACSRPLIALNELFGASLPPPWSPTNAQYRANVLSFIKILAARGARPFLLISSRPYTGGEAADWWRQVAQVADLVREVYFNAPSLHQQGAVLGSRSLRKAFRRAAGELLAIGIPPSRIGLMLGFQTTPGSGGRERLEPAGAWFEVVKLQALAARQVARELKLASVWSWGWGAWSGPERDPDKQIAACVWLWARIPKLCDGPHAAGPAFNISRSEGQIDRLGSAQCRLETRAIGQFTLARLTAMTGDREIAYTALFARAVESEQVRVTTRDVLAAERAVVANRFGRSYASYRAALARARANVAVARGVIADELRRARLQARLSVRPPSGAQVSAYYSSYSSILTRAVQLTPAPAWLGGRRRGLALSSVAPPQVFSLPTGRRARIRTMSGQYRVRPLGPTRPLSAVPLARARAAIVAALEGFARTNAYQAWTTTQQTRALKRLVCARDDLPDVGEVELSSYLPFLALDG
jgi:hypothetical protein